MYCRIQTLITPEAHKALPQVRLFAVLGPWMDEDVIEATVKNAIIQGCERVYLVDNASEDDTVARATAAGAILARTYATERYDEALRLRHMNEVAAEVSASEGDEYLWWLFLDADEFPHGPSGLTLSEYVRSIDSRIRVVGARFFNHYPSAAPASVAGRHPIDYQPLCEEISLPMCAAGHRKHPILRFDKGGPAVKAGVGFHLVVCSENLFEPTQPMFIHHFPFREESVTRRKLSMIWRKDPHGMSRADLSDPHNSHMLARQQSVDAVYQQDWENVVNFVALDPIVAASLDTPPQARGVTLQPWSQAVEERDQTILRWYGMDDVWKYDELSEFHYGDDTTYRIGLKFLDGHGVIEDWGCGFCRAKAFVEKSQYMGIDGSSPHADIRTDLVTYRSTVDCIFMRHVLEHNAHWRTLLANALSSFRKRMVLVIFTPMSEVTHIIKTSDGLTSFPVPDISFRKSDLTEMFQAFRYEEIRVLSDTQYGEEHLFLIERLPSSALGRLFYFFFSRMRKILVRTGWMS